MLPVHRLSAGAAADQPIEELSKGSNKRIERGLPAGHDPGEVTADRDADQKADQQSQSDLQPSLNVMVVPPIRTFRD